MTDQTPPSTSSSRSTRTLILTLLFLIGLLVGRYVVPDTTGTLPLKLIGTENSERQLLFPTFWETWDLLHENFIGELDEKKLLYGAVEGMVRAAGDPYTTFADPKNTKLLEEMLQGSFSGVGIEIGLKNGLITVIAPLDGTPAHKAGIKEGDVIVAIDKEPLTQDYTIDQVVQRIRGQKGSKVTLTVISPNSNETKDHELIRDTITIESVKWSKDGDIATIRISSFNGDTASRFAAAARDIHAANAKGIILDLRGNPGGYLSAAVDIASEFVETGKVIVSEKGKDPKEYKSTGIGNLRSIPTVILVDGGSASASEILAGALKDQNSTTLIGTKTFGKGSVQEFIELDDGSSLKVTIAKWFTPSGASINEEGIEPTIKVEQNRDTEADEQLDRAKEEIQKIVSPTSPKS